MVELTTLCEQTIIATTYGMALADPSVPCVITRWLGLANQTEFIALQGAVLQYYEQHSTPAAPWGWVGDVRRTVLCPDAWLPLSIAVRPGTIRP